MLLGRQLVALEERQNYSLGLRKKKIARIIHFPSQHFLTDTSLGECFVQEYLSRDWCVFACTCEGGKRGGMPLADNNGRFQPSYILLLCTFTYEHTQTHTAPGVLYSFPVHSEVRQAGYDYICPLIARLSEHGSTITILFNRLRYSIIIFNNYCLTVWLLQHQKGLASGDILLSACEWLIMT